MKYYLHDTNSRNDEKVTLLFINFGYEGVGLFYSILEVLASQEKPVDENVLRSQLKIGKKLEKPLNFMYKIGILSLKNGDVFNENILKYSEKYQIKKEKNRERIAEWRSKQEDSENVTCYKSVRNNPKVNKSKVKESNIEILPQNQKEVLELNEMSKVYFDVKFINKTSLDLFDKLIRIDGYTREQILQAIKFGRGDPFWTTNFLSPQKLRNKNKDGVKYIDVFLAKRLSNENNQGGNKPKYAASDEQLKAIITKHFPANKDI